MLRNNLSNYFFSTRTHPKIFAVSRVKASAHLLFYFAVINQRDCQSLVHQKVPGHRYGLERHRSLHPAYSLDDAEAVELVPGHHHPFHVLRRNGRLGEAKGGDGDVVV